MSDYAEMPGHRIRRLHQIATAIFVEMTAEAGFDLTPVQYAALAALDAHPGVDQATLAGLVAYDRATLGDVIDRLERRGYVTRRVSPVDRRARTLDLTSAGRSLVATVAPVVGRVQEEILEGLTGDERDTLARLLSKLIEVGNERARAPMRAPGRADGRNRRPEG